MIEKFPPRWHFALFSTKELLTGKLTRKSYSQAGEDLIAEPLLKQKRGLYVDVGAHHPFRGSDTKLFYKRGWHGINIEPNPDLLFLFKLFRPRDINLSLGISGKEALLEFYMFSEPGVNTFGKEEAERRIKKGNVAFLKKTLIPVRTLASVFEEYSVGHIDLLNVDAEGLDLQVLESNDWSRWRPSVIIVEDNAFEASHPEKSPVHAFLLGQGYSLHGSSGVSLIFKLP